MSKSNTIGAVILGAAAGVAILKFFNMPEEEREEFYAHLKERADKLLEVTEGTIETIKSHFAQIDEKAKEEWVDKLLIAKNLLNELFGSAKKYLA